MKLRRPAAVIFDMDGLIFNTEALYEESLLGEAKAHAVDGITQAVARATVGLSWPATRDLLANLLPIDLDVDDFIVRWTSRYDRLTTVRLATKPGIRELLDVLEKLAIPRAVATGSNRKTANDHLASHDLLHRFAVVIAGEDCSGGKPMPEPFLKAAEALGQSPEDCWALEDSVNGVLAAHRAGMTTIMIPDLVEPDAETAACCALVLKTLLDVTELLRD